MEKEELLLNANNAMISLLCLLDTFLVLLEEFLLGIANTVDSLPHEIKAASKSCYIFLNSLSHSLSLSLSLCVCVCVCVCVFVCLSVHKSISFF